MSASLNPRLCLLICASSILLLILFSKEFRHRQQERHQRDLDFFLDSTELPAEHIDPAAIDLTPLVNTLINTSQSGSRQLFSLLSVTSYSSLALHKLTLLVYNISSMKNLESNLFRRRFCYCVTNETNDLTDFTAILLDVMGNSTSYLQEIFKSASILSVSQRNNSDCIYICVMAGKMGREVPELWEVDSITPLFNQTIVEGPHGGNVSSIKLPVEWHQLPTNLSHAAPSGMSSMLTSRVHSTAHGESLLGVEGLWSFSAPRVEESAATTTKGTATSPQAASIWSQRPTTDTQATKTQTTEGGRDTTTQDTEYRPDTTVQAVTEQEETTTQTTGDIWAITAAQSTADTPEMMTEDREDTTSPQTTSNIQMITTQTTADRPEPTTTQETEITTQTTARATTQDVTTQAQDTEKSTLISTLQPTTSTQPTTTWQVTTTHPAATITTQAPTERTTSLPGISLTPPTSTTQHPSVPSGSILSTAAPIRPVHHTAAPTLAGRTTESFIKRTTIPSRATETEKPGCPWTRTDQVDVFAAGSTTTVSAHKLQPCVFELCKFFSQCLCRPFSHKTRMKRYCDDSHLWYEKHTSEVCRRVRRVSFSRNLKQRCLMKMCNKL